MLIHAKMYFQMFSFLCNDHLKKRTKGQSKKWCCNDGNHYGKSMHEFGRDDDVEDIFG